MALLTDHCAKMKRTEQVTVAARARDRATRRRRAGRADRPGGDALLVHADVDDAIRPDVLIGFEGVVGDDDDVAISGFGRAGEGWDEGEH